MNLLTLEGAGGCDTRRAFVIGIDRYQNGLPALASAGNDAKEVARVLQERHGFRTELFLDASLQELETLFSELASRDLPVGHARRIEEPDHVLIYFAGHGIKQASDRGPTGFLAPATARRGETESYLPMSRVTDLLGGARDPLGNELPARCHHLLIVLDCCFAGAARWAASRELGEREVVYRQRFRRFLAQPAHQVLTSATARQVAADQVFGEREEEGRHSPFARALLGALDPDGRHARGSQPTDKWFVEGVATAAELRLYLVDEMSKIAGTSGLEQTPGIWQTPDSFGEFVFVVSGDGSTLQGAPALREEDSPYRGLEAFGEEHEEFFFGREEMIKELRDRVSGKKGSSALTVVVGASGSGKSSLVHAGLIPALRKHSPTAKWLFLLPSRTAAGDAHAEPLGRPAETEPAPRARRHAPLRPGAHPLSALAAALATAATVTIAAPDAAALASGPFSLAEFIGRLVAEDPDRSVLLVVDQFEELVTECQTAHDRECFIELLSTALREHPDKLRIVLTVRSDFEPQFVGDEPKGGADEAAPASARPASRASWYAAWNLGRTFVKPPTRAELRATVERPASRLALFFTPGLVEQILDEVADAPGALPLLSFTLQQLYLRYLAHGAADDRELSRDDYENLGGVAGSIRTQANEIYTGLDDDERDTLRRVLLRMVTLEGGEPARRRVPRDELKYPDPEENKRVDIVLDELLKARLIVRGITPEKVEVVEPAHDQLLRGWGRYWDWIQHDKENIILLRRLTEAARQWQQATAAEHAETRGAIAVTGAAGSHHRRLWRWPWP